MADVFISYKREDRAWAEAVSAKLVEAGWSTWWDTSLVAGERFSDVIGRELVSSKAVIVLWSAASLTSNWVKAEAQHAFDTDKIVAARIEDVAPGFPFQSIQTCDLIATQPRFATPAQWAALLQGVRRKIGAEAKPSISVGDALAVARATKAALRAHLIEVARARDLVTYQEVAAATGVPLGEALFDALNAVAVDNRKQGEPVLSALVVGRDGAPGEGFFTRRWIEVSPEAPQTEKLAAWRNECERVWTRWEDWALDEDRAPKAS
ncbi:MAG: toll/interleukin-1 receptor domain-containing protein [Hyphomonadaceae bacterium]|nr:toll/interleukin-1 receptor domain-containing protein [Hyphomonadaceae bacterium]